jgi:cation-transporting ATPase F
MMSPTEPKTADWHALLFTDVASLMNVVPDKGLDELEASRRCGIYGPNIVSTKKGKHPILRFLLQFREPLMFILVVAGVVTAFIEEWVDSAVIFGVVLVIAAAGFVQEMKAGKALEALVKMVATEATVVRSGSKRRLPSSKLVPGDVVILRSGDKVPADARLFRTRELRIDESVLTGESAPVAKSVDVLKPDTVLADRKNMAYSGTLVTYGQGFGIVVSTGDATEAGKISKSISSAEEMVTPLTRKIARFSKFLLYFIIGLAAATFAVGIIQNQLALEETFMSAVALAVAAIPEGLPAALTITLAIGVSRMAKRHAIVRRLPAVEALGSITLICSDKTGTLTENQMTVTEIYANNISFEVTGTGYHPEGIITDRGAVDSQSLGECLTAGLLCNDSQLVERDGQWDAAGDPTEVALIVSARKFGLREEELQRRFPRVDAIPFESHLQYMATLHRFAEKNQNIIYIKGAPEKVIQKCSFIAKDDGPGRLLHIPALTDERRVVLQRAEEMAAKGLRVLAFAKMDASEQKNSLDDKDLDRGLVFLGLQGMLDPPRQEAASAIRACQNAGIRVKMITGDNVKTAAMIAKKIGLNNIKDKNGSSEVIAVTGYDLTNYSDSELKALVEKADVFARVSPEQKLQLVKALQAKGHIVAVTGDGVNDAPALKQADIGVAMGIRGTDVAKEAADIVLTDDNFASIEAAVEEGRGIFDNIRKFVTWTLPTNFGEALIIVTAIFAGFSLPLLPVQILWINMTTALALGMMLVFEPKELDIMKRKPRKPDSPILTRELIQRVILVSIMILASVLGLFIWHQNNGASMEEARTVAVNALIMIELSYLFNSRSLEKSIFQVGMLTNKWIVAGAVIMIGLQLLYTYLPPMNSLFKSAPISLESWGMIIAAASTTFVVVELEKWIKRRRIYRKD